MKISERTHPCLKVISTKFYFLFEGDREQYTNRCNEKESGVPLSTIKARLKRGVKESELLK